MEIDVVVMGELLVDIIGEEPNLSIEETELYRRFQGGSPANVALNLRYQGASPVLVSCVGSDSIGTYLIKHLQRLGLSTDHIAVHPSLPTSLVLVGRSTSTPDFIAYRTADRHIAPVPNTLLDRAKVIHSGAFALSLSPARESILEAFAYGYKKGKVLSVDWNYSPRIWSGDGRDVFKQLCDFGVLIKMSLDDVARFVGVDLSYEEAKEYLAGFTSSLVCLTCGKDGVWYKEGKGLWKFKAAQPVAEVKDTTGAGDAFWSAVLFGILRGRSIDTCISDSVTLAAKKVQHVGPLYTNPLPGET